MCTQFDDEGDAPQLTMSRRSGAPVELIATVLLALSTLVAVTAVSIGIARADVIGDHSCRCMAESFLVSRMNT